MTQENEEGEVPVQGGEFVPNISNRPSHLCGSAADQNSRQRQQGVRRCLKILYLGAKFLLVFFRQAAALLILLVFSAQTFSRYVIVADYYLNTEAYARDCVNKDKPWMHCNGHCQMCKRMAEQDRSDKQNPQHKSATEDGGPISSKSSFTDISSLMFIEGTALRRPDNTSARAITMPRSYFHPPGAELA